MRTGRALGGALVLALGAACGLDTSGLGTASGAMPIEDDDGSEAQDGGTSTSSGSEGASGDAGSSGGAIDPDSGPDSTTAGDDDPSDGSTGAIDPCQSPTPQTFDITVDLALLDAAMHLDSSTEVGTYAYSETMGAGRASFEIDVQCQAEFRVWAFVHDPAAGPLDVGTLSDPDSYLVAFDGQEPADWWYGCQLYAARLFGGPTWAWVPVCDNGLCIDEEFRRTLGPGTHLFHMTNREAGNHVSGDVVGDVAAVTRVVITSDPAFSP